jgi:hypothetical protein
MVRAGDGRELSRAALAVFIAKLTRAPRLVCGTVTGTAEIPVVRKAELQVRRLSPGLRSRTGLPMFPWPP